MGCITVEPAGLVQYAVGLTRLGEELAVASRSLVAAGPDVMGSATLGAAFDGLCADWQVGLGRTANAAWLLGEQLLEAVRVYRETEAAVAADCG